MHHMPLFLSIHKGMILEIQIIGIIDFKTNTSPKQYIIGQSICDTQTYVRGQSSAGQFVLARGLSREYFCGRIGLRGQ